MIDMVDEQLTLERLNISVIVLRAEEWLDSRGGADMLRVLVELKPFGMDRGTKILGTLEIGNDGTGTPTSGAAEACLGPGVRRSHAPTSGSNG